MIDPNIIDEITCERLNQNRKWGADSIVHRTLEAGLRVLVEEVGEVAKAINERDPTQLRVELTQTAAVAVAMLEALNHGAALVAPRNEGTRGENHEHKA